MFTIKYHYQTYNFCLENYNYFQNFGKLFFPVLIIPILTE